MGNKSSVGRNSGEAPHRPSSSKRRTTMGNANSVKTHIMHAEKTGVCVLSAMNLDEFPGQLMQLVGNLRTLDLSNNKLKQLPEAIASFTFLKNLSLNQNQLATLAEGLSQLKKLEILSATNNRLTHLPRDLHACVSLKTVTLKCNRLRDFPVQLTRLKHLDAVDLSENDINSLPDQLRDIRAVEINLNRNQVSALPSCLAASPRLKVLRFEENCVSLEGISPRILCESQISLLVYDGNLFSQKEFQQIEGYDKYMERYTATKRKFD